MVNAQELIDSKKEATEINLTELLYNKDENKLKYDEEGELRIGGFKNLKEIKIDMVGEGEEGYVKFAKIIKITIDDCPELKEVDINTFIDNKELKITSCPKLTYLDCSYNKLEKLDLNELVLNNNDNKSGKNISLENGSSGKKSGNCLKILDLRKNKFSDFSFLDESSLTNLRTLYLDKNEFNKPLKDLKTKTPNLKEFGVTETNIELDLSNLPSDLERVYCDSEKLKKELKFCEKEDNEKEKYYDYQDWKKLTNAQNWLDEHYPKDGETKHFRIGGRKKKGKTKTIELNISNKWLKGDLKLEQFTDLEKLDCSNNYLTSLDLKDCEKLTYLTLSNNQFDNVEFLKTLPKKTQKNLKILKISNNEKLPIQTLDFLKDFTGLEELHIEDCPFEGSLEPLKDMKNLKKIYISHTDIEEGLEHLPESCKKLYCDFRYQSEHKTIEIVKQLGKHLEEGKIRYYNLDKWRQEKKDGVALIIPLDKLPSSKNSIKKFLEKWKTEIVKGGNGTDEKAWYSRFINTFTVKDDNPLKDPEQLKKSGEKFSKWEAGLKVPSIAGGILSLADYSIVGGAMSVVSPAVEFLVEQAGKKQYEADKEKWDNFVRDSEDVWDAYWELRETFKFIKPYDESGKVNEALSYLKKEIDGFLEEPKEFNNDSDHDTKNNISKSNFPEHLRDDWEKKSGELEEIRKAIENLQEKVSDYRRAFLGKKDNKIQEEQIKVIKNKTDDLSEILKDIESYYQKASVMNVNEDKVKKIINNLRKSENELRDEVGKFSTKQEVDSLNSDSDQAETSSSSQQSTTNNKGKDKEINENIQEQYEAQQLQEVKVVPNYGSTGTSK